MRKITLAGGFLRWHHLKCFHKFTLHDDITLSFNIFHDHKYTFAERIHFCVLAEFYTIRNHIDEISRLYWVQTCFFCETKNLFFVSRATIFLHRCINSEWPCTILIFPWYTVVVYRETTLWLQLQNYYRKTNCVELVSCGLFFFHEGTNSTSYQFGIVSPLRLRMIEGRIKGSSWNGTAATII